MSWILAGISALFLGKEYIKEKRQPIIPASYWRNKELMDEDKLNPNVSPEQVMKNLENGKYYLSDEEYAKRNQPKDYSQREGEDINQWMNRLARERQERADKLYGQNKK